MSSRICNTIPGEHIWPVKSPISYDAQLIRQYDYYRAKDRKAPVPDTEAEAPIAFFEFLSRTRPGDSASPLPPQQ